MNELLKKTFIGIPAFMIGILVTAASLRPYTPYNEAALGSNAVFDDLKPESWQRIELNDKVIFYAPPELRQITLKDGGVYRPDIQSKMFTMWNSNKSLSFGINYSSSNTPCSIDVKKGALLPKLYLTVDGRKAEFSLNPTMPSKDLSYQLCVPNVDKHGRNLSLLATCRDSDCFSLITQIVSTITFSPE